MKKIPTTLEIQEKISSNLRTSFNLVDSDYKEVIDALSSVLAAQFKTLYLFVGDNRRNLFPDTADVAEEGGELEHLGNIYLNRQPKQATFGEYIVKLTGFPGAVIRSGLTFKSSEISNSPGFLFTSDIEYIMPNSDGLLILRSLNSGLDYLLKIGDKLNATEPVIGLDSEVEVLQILSLPLSAESVSVYRNNIKNAIQLEPSGGSRTDYRLWSSEVLGVRLVYPYVKEGFPGINQIFVEATKLDSIDEKGTPSLSLLNDVEEAIYFDPDNSIDINLRGRIPMGAGLEVLPIQLKPVDVNIFGLTEQNPEIILSIRKNIDSYLINIRPFIAGADLLRNKSDVLYNYRISSVILDTIGKSVFFLNFSMNVDGNELNQFTFSGANIPYLRNLNLL